MKHVTISISALALSFLILSHFAFGQSSGNDDESPAAVSTTPDTVAVDDVAGDSEIAQRLQRIFEATGWFDEVNVRSQNGFVTISGAADTDEHSAWAEAIATRTTDVIGVSNQLQVDSRIDFAGAMTVVGQSLNDLSHSFLMHLPFILAGLVVVAITWVVSTLVGMILRRILNNQIRLRKSLQDLLLQLASITTWIIGLLIATVIVFPGMTPAKALTVLGLGSVAIGFAFKDIFENFFAGILILWRYPFDRGDFIQHGDISGKVEEITIRNTLIRRTDGELVVVPNGQLFKSNVEVLTDRSRRRVRIICGVGYGEDLERSRDVILKAVQSCQTVDDSQEVQVLAHEFADSGINFEVAWWTAPTPLDVRRSRGEVITAIKSALDEAKIEIPFPYRTLTFAEPLTLDENRAGRLAPAMQNGRE